MTSRILLRGAAVGLSIVCAAGLVACRSSSGGNGTAVPAPTSASVTESSLPSDTADASPTPTDSSSSTAATSTAATHASTSASPKPPATPACTSASLRVGVLRGGAVPGREIALITFTNTSTKPCTLRGFPTLLLRLNGQPIGSPASHSVGLPVRVVTLAPNAQAESQITDRTSCQAPVSDTGRISAPGVSGFVDRPLELRACTVFVDPVSHS